MHFHRALVASVVREPYVRIASAAVGETHHILLLLCKELKQSPRSVGIGVYVATIGHQRMRGTPDLSAFACKVDVAITAEPGVTRPLVSGKRDETSSLIELGAEAIELRPKSIGNLKIVALMSRRIDKGLVACKLEVLPRAVGTDGFLRLPV